MKWTIIKDDTPYVIPSTGKKQRRVIAQCECGTIKSVMYTYIKTGRSKSCGCVQREVWKTINVKHQMKQTAEYRTWGAMKTRCYNPNYVQYKDYGGRGIKICDRWLNSFISFYQDMGPRPSPKHSIDRINNNGDYEPSNCRWATSSEQNKNRRKRNG